MKKIYIVDAVNYLFRSYYAIGPMMTARGESTSALYGFIRSVQKLIKLFSPEHLVCVFDGPDNKKTRRAVYAEYKMHRKGAPEDLFAQFEWANAYCEMAGLPTLCIEGVEADDTMASVAVWAEKKGAEAYLCTSDKDLMQLIGEKIFLLHPAKEYQLIDTAKVRELFSVRPDQMLDLLAIMGDPSDNIPGLEGFGPKTAASLLQEFDTLDNLLAHPERVKGEKKQQTLKEQKEVALMSRKLATLDLEVEIPKTEEFYRIKEPDREQLIEFYHQMQFNSLLRELDEIQPKSSKKHSTDARNYQLVETEEALSALFKKLNCAKEVSLDTETTDESPFQAKLVGIGFCMEPGETWYIPCNGALKKESVEAALAEFFASAKCNFYGHNIKYDLHVLRQNLGVEIEKISFDTLLASYLLNPEKRRHNLDDLCLEKLKKTKIPITDLIGKGKKQISMWDAPVAKVSEYCGEDVDYTARLKELFEEELKRRGLDSLLFKIELPLLPILASMEQEGIYLDVEKLKKQGEMLVKGIEQLKETIFEKVGETFNLNSPKQLSHILFDKLGMKKPPRARTEFSTGANILEELAIEHPLVYEIIEYRVLEKLRTTYIEALPTSIHPETQRIHCTFNQSVAATGRLSCQNPNLQNIPVRTKEGMAIRSCFKPQRKGWSFVGGDYSQIELRLLAHFSQDRELLTAFKEGEDIHAYTASLVFNIPIGFVTPAMRSQAKAVNFGIIYGQGPFGLSKQLRIPYSEAAQFIKTYFERYPDIRAYLDSCKAEARKTGVSRTLTGRERPIPELSNPNPSIRAAAERLAVNTPLQGTAADLIKLAMIEIDCAIAKKSLQGKMILQIHDELIFEVPDEEVPIFKKLVKEKMEHVCKLTIPLEVEIAVGKNWAEC